MDKVTIVTVVYNAHDLMEDTLLSVIQQTYLNIEYIVIDGGSTDGTVEIIKKYENHISHWVSEPDEGLYDAMNKAINLATGKWINFMNAGDVFYDKDVVRDLMDRVPQGTDFIYGNHIWEGEVGKAVVEARPLELMWQRISFSHQSLFSSVELMKKRPFVLSYSIVCDYEFYFYYYMKKKVFWNSGSIIAVVISGGVSEVNFFKRTYERWKVVKQYKNSLRVHLFYINIIIKQLIHNMKVKLRGALR